VIASKFVPTDLMMNDSTSRLVVAVTATAERIGEARRVRVNEAYTDAIVGAGMIPLVVPPIELDGDAERVLSAVDGLVLTGGEDVDPGLFGAPRHPATQPAHAARDRCELALLLAARERRVPTLAICRGAQLVNVAFGGTLVQDLPTERPGAIGHNPGGSRAARVHRVDIESSSRLARAIGATTISTNSFHHQSVDRPGNGLRVSATAVDGTVEGIEPTDPEWWMLGVQWHPEELTRTVEDWDRRLFAAFARACGDAVSSTAATALHPALGA